MNIFKEKNLFFISNLITGGVILQNLIMCLSSYIIIPFYFNKKSI